ncbi:N-acetyltransferase [Streptomyces sp. NPDC048290]|uniref:N-acetyltransferase n=1 Tax=Streptomyces sp. NPDC048290 TaxID=3155811 RepID=UPI003434203E
MPTVRPFHRADRDQLTDLINLHIAAVVPGVSVSVNTVLSALERQPDEFITDPWVAERVTLVAEARRHVVAAAHLLRYRADAEVGADYRGTGEVTWFVSRPGASFLPDADKAAELLMNACLAQLARWDVRVRHADGALPAPGVYGVPHAWPHIRAVYENAGFRHTGDTEVLLIGRVADLPQPRHRAGVRVERTLGGCGTRLTAYGADGDPLGHVEVDTSIARPERHTRAAGLADIGDLVVVRENEGWEEWLLGQAADWLRWCGTERILAYEDANDQEAIDRLNGLGFQELTRTDRGWRHGPMNVHEPVSE